MTKGDGLRLGAALAVLVLLAVLFRFNAPAPAAAIDRVDPASYRVETVAADLHRPWSVAFLPDGRALVTLSEGGLLAIEKDGRRTSISMNGFPPVVQGGQTGQLMQVAVDPQFAQNGLLYFSMGYGEPGANGTRVVRAMLVAARLQDARVIFNGSLKSAGANNGGAMAFLPDGSFVLTVGDGEQRQDAQSLSSHLGKVVRLDREGRPLADNPFNGQAGAAPGVYAVGLRNPQGIAFDVVTQRLLLTDHGPRGGDEINVITPGQNYGWPVVTGGIDYSFARVTPFTRLGSTTPPVLEWTPSIAPAGLAVYDGTLFQGWRGDLLVPALKERSVRRVVRKGGEIVSEQLLLAERGERVRDVRMAPDGSVYVLTDGEGAKLLRLVPAS